MVSQELLMAIKFSEDLVPLTDLKVNPGRVVKHTTEAHCHWALADY